MNTTTETKSRPIIFSAPMIRAILEGRKTQTRRIVKPQPQVVQLPPRAHRDETVGRRMWRMNGTVFSPAWWGRIRADDPPQLRPPKQGEKLELWIGHEEATGKGITQNAYAAYCRYGAPGDELWVKEKWVPDAPRDGTWADVEFFGCNDSKFSLIPPRFRKPKHCIYAASWDGHEIQWRSSLFMPRWASRITLRIESVRVERVQDTSEADAIAEGCDPGTQFGPAEIKTSAKNIFVGAWTELNGPASWNANPWVWVVSFKVVQPEGLARAAHASGRNVMRMEN